VSIFGLAGNAVLDALVAEAADNLRFHHAMSRKAKLRTFASFMYQSTSWQRPRKVVARLECSLQPVAGETGMRQEVDIRYVVTSLEGTAQHIYEDVYCQRGQMENLIKLHKAQLASDRMSCQQRDGQSGATCSAHRRLVDARRARCDPVRTVVWEGRSCEAPPYPDLGTS
jgi:GTP cyclohydrolase FolE2